MKSDIQSQAYLLVYTHKIPTLKTRGPSTGQTPRLQGSAKYMVTVRKPRKESDFLLAHCCSHRLFLHNKSVVANWRCRASIAQA